MQSLSTTFYDARSGFERRLRLLLLPYQIGIGVLFVLPALIAFSLAFFRYNGLVAPQYVGWRNFVLVYTDELFTLSIRNTLAFVLLPAPLRVFGAFLLARLMLRGSRRLLWLRSAVLLPTVIPAPAYALAWLWILNPVYGPLNLLLAALGVAPPAWLIDPQWVRPGVMLALLWQIGEGFLVSLAALSDIPIELEDAARTDGAASVQVLRYITLPLIAPILLLLLFRDAILLLQESFTTIWLMTQGGPYYATYTLPLFIYEQGFDLLSFGTASAALWVLYLLIGVVIVLLYIVARQWQIGITEEHFLL